jgi:DNA-binding response OmpR family regulator
MASGESQIGSIVKNAPSPRATQSVAGRVLLIDDSEDGMLFVEHALQDCRVEEYRLEWAKTLSNGLDQLAYGGIDLVVLDLGLPECSGSVSYAWVRQVTRDVPVVVLTGDLREDTEFSVTASGVEDYLVKDQISGAQLVQAIRIALFARTEHQYSKIQASKLTRRSLSALP